MTARINRPSLAPLLLPLLLYLLPHLSSLSTPPPHAPRPPSIPLTPTQRSLLSTTVTSRLHTLANITATPPFTNRPYLTPASRAAQSLLSLWMAAANLSTTVDPAGNVIGDLRCPSGRPRKPLVLGSHHDTVPRAGRFDGLLGVVTAISVAQVLAPRICGLPFDLRVIAFDDEEGNNPFGSTNLGARAYTGTVDWETHIPSKPSFFAAYREIHGPVDPVKAIASAKGEAPLAYLELHLEQGPVLERRGKSVGVVDAIAGQTRLKVRLTGEAGHAGTVPMGMRRDALAAAAEGVLAVERAPRGVVATVGQLVVSPGVGNVIPGGAEVSVDIRSADDAAREAAVRAATAAFHRAGRKRGVAAVVQTVHDVPAVEMTGWVQRVLSKVPDVDGGVVTSGAGHDAQIMAAVTDVGMLFVRCRGGVSHRPDEFVEDADVFRAGMALLNAVLAIGERVRPEAS